MYMKERRLSIGALSLKSGVAYSTLYKILHEPWRAPKIDTLRKLAGAMDAPLSALTDDIDAESTTPRPIHDLIPAGPMIFLPVFEEVKAGEGGCLVMDTPVGYEQVSLDRVKHDIEHYFLFRVRGDSMAGVGIMDKSLVLVHEQPVVDDNQIALIVLPDGSNTVKRVRLLNEHILLLPANSAYREQQYGRNEVHICGRVMQAIIQFD